MIARKLLIICLFLMVLAAPAWAQDDAVWIEAHLRNGGGAAIGAASQNRTPDPIAVGNLGNFVGQDIRLHLISGRVRVGLLEKVDGKDLYLRSRMGGGYATISLKRAQVVKAELE